MTTEHDQWLRYRQEIYTLLLYNPTLLSHEKIEDYFSPATLKEINERNLFERIYEEEKNATFDEVPQINV